mgnify:CR=1 FL=1
MADFREERSWERAEKRLDYYLRDRPLATSALCLFLTGMYAYSCWLDWTRGQSPWKVLAWNRSRDLMTELGARTGDLVQTGEWHRLLRYGLLHWNAGHLAMNVAAQWAIGEVLEAVYGPARVLLLFAVSTLTGGLGSWMAGGAMTVGASGGAFGFLGAMVAFGWRWGGRLSPHTRRWFGPVLWPWVIGNLALGLVLPFIDNGAHVGGLLGGMALGAAYGNRVTDNGEAGDAVRWAVRGLSVVLYGWALLSV